MNNFTKEELEKILSCVDFTCWEHPCEAKKLTDIRLKIQAMIVNYPKPGEPVSHRFIVKPEAVPCLTKNEGKIELYKIYLPE